MRSIRQKIDSQLYNQSLQRPCIYVPPGFEVQLWIQKGDDRGEYQMSLLEADKNNIVRVEDQYCGHGDVHSYCRIWIMQSNVQVWLKPKTIDKLNQGD